MNLTLDINGFDVPAHFEDETVQTLLIPLLKELSVRRETLDRRMIVFLAAPPAAGKSTLAAFLEHLSKTTPNLTPVQALGMDGFHYPQDYILSHTILRNGIEVPMKLLKGVPKSFDMPKLLGTLTAARDGNCRWPYYDRRIHDVVEDAISVAAPILIIEGNWLLLNSPEWACLPRDCSIFISAGESELRSRLIDRKMRGGLTQREAEEYYLRSDGPNIHLCLAQSLPADYTYLLTGDGDYRLA